MTIQELEALLDHVHQEHQHFNKKTKRVKYVRFSFDNRDSTIFAITFDDVTLSATNENLKRNLFKWAWCYLDNQDDQTFNFERDDPELFNILRNNKMIEKLPFNLSNLNDFTTVVFKLNEVIATLNKLTCKETDVS